MIEFLLVAQLLTVNPENQKFCASVVGVPYGTDNITDAEWEQFQRCMKFFERDKLDT